MNSGKHIKNLYKNDGINFIKYYKILYVYIKSYSIIFISKLFLVKIFYRIYVKPPET